MNVENRVKELVEEKLADRPDLFIVSISMHANRLTVLLDGDNGIGIADCVAVSRHVGYHLEEENTIDTAYNLEVSSPGIDTPLKDIRQYRKNVGRRVQVKQTDGKKREGQLEDVSDEGIQITEKIKPEKGKKMTEQQAFIPFDQITETKVIISFN